MIAIVLSPKIYNEKTSLCLCLPITSKIKGYPFEVVLSDQIKNLDFTVREITFICKADDNLIQTVQKNVLALVME
ncbi:MAG: type II toxin-antitoxin system PemK/MazF family toxin [Epsilonproteobacteria bacterium]|nr:type II toxin-antitoxin system PemK/MazF family toxin [Campylobacterota bacterium]